MTRNVNPGRLAAVRALVGIDEGGYAEDLLGQLAPASGPDRGLAWHIVLGVLRRRGALDALLAPFVRRGVEALDSPVRAALRMGAFELKLSRTPNHAAVDQAVEACRKAGAPRASGLVNAVLRKAAGASLSADPADDLPAWLRDRWSGYGAWVARLSGAPPICGVWKDGPVEQLPHVATPGGTFRLVDPSGPIPEMPGFAEGRWWIMDPAAVRVADMAAEVAPGDRVLDACAAPGGKSFRLASRGLAVTAIDSSDERLQLLRDMAERLHFDIPTGVHDWLEGPCPVLGEFDVVLVDAPCTALGTVRRHPEIKWRRLPSDPAAMALRQLPILEAASIHVKPGGALVYAVCSTEPEEGRGVVGELSGWAVTEEWSSVPPEGDEDAFQVFVLRREGGSPG